LHHDGGLSIVNMLNHHADLAMNSLHLHHVFDHAIDHVIERRHKPDQRPISSNTKRRTSSNLRWHFGGQMPNLRPVSSGVIFIFANF
jgi:hypothetical protein